MSDKKKERRRFKRRRISIPIQIKLKSYDDFIRQYITDISAGGLFIATPTPYEINDEVDIEFFIEKQEGYFFKVRGSVNRLHDSPRGMGIRFTEIEEGSQQLLEQLLTKIEEETNA